MREINTEKKKRWVSLCGEPNWCISTYFRNDVWKVL